MRQRRLFGMLPWAGGLPGWRQRARLYPASWLGLVPVCLGVISLSVAGLYWGLWPP